MPDNDTTPVTDDTQENWESRYSGLQKVVAKRDTDLAARQAELDALRAEHEAATTELAEHRQKAVDANEDEQARATYEALKERFAPNPRPVGNNPARDWAGGSGGRYADRERADTGGGFPT